jgi:hypothetical protein
MRAESVLFAIASYLYGREGKDAVEGMEFCEDHEHEMLVHFEDNTTLRVVISEVER